jgi:hypothetical protein
VPIIRRKQLFQRNIWYLSLCVGDRLVMQGAMELTKFVLFASLYKDTRSTKHKNKKYVDLYLNLHAFKTMTKHLTFGAAFVL